VNYVDVRLPAKGDVWVGNYRSYVILDFLIDAKTLALNVAYIEKFPPPGELGFTMALGDFLGVDENYLPRFVLHKYEPIEPFLAPDTPVTADPLDDIPF
jgi:hypothetical protein